MAQAEPFDVFYVREYPTVVGLLQGLLGSRIVAEELAQVWEAVRTLPPSQAQVIALHCYEDYSVGPIAAARGRAPGTNKAQLHQGRGKLARLLDDGTDGGRPT